MIQTRQQIKASDFIKQGEANATPSNDAGRVVKLENDGKMSEFFIKEVSESKIINRSAPFFFQEWATKFIASEQNSNNEGFAMGSSPDGSVVYSIDYDYSGAYYWYLIRRVRDINTGMYFQTHRVDITSIFFSFRNSSIVQIGSYIYLFSGYTSGSPCYVKCYRFLASDLSGQTLMTIPNISIGYSPSLSSVTAWTDGTFLYVTTDTISTQVYKLSISGTTLSTVTTGNTGGNYIGSTMFDGTNIYILSYAWYTNGGTFTVYKANDVYFSYPSQTTINLGANLGGNNGAILEGHIHIFNIGSNKMYVGLTAVSSPYSLTGVTNAPKVYLFPVTKP